MGKGKAHKKYEYGCKASAVLTQKTGIVVGATNFKENRYDGHTLAEVLKQTIKLTVKLIRPQRLTGGIKENKW
ncbi:hypothetical protein [Aquimarina discodermiae]|uniref:hypothetical protein n=1 Tax=Aquimarina discodermiae TaxID=3231043 RepID=UPI00403A8E47